MKYKLNPLFTLRKTDKAVFNFSRAELTQFNDTGFDILLAINSFRNSSSSSVHSLSLSCSRTANKISKPVSLNCVNSALEKLKTNPTIILRNIAFLLPELYMV